MALNLHKLLSDDGFVNLTRRVDGSVEVLWDDVVAIVGPYEAGYHISLYKHTDEHIDEDAFEVRCIAGAVASEIVAELNLALGVKDVPNRFVIAKGNQGIIDCVDNIRIYDNENLSEVHMTAVCGFLSNIADLQIADKTIDDCGTDRYTIAIAVAHLVFYGDCTTVTEVQAFMDCVSHSYLKSLAANLSRSDLESMWVDERITASRSILDVPTLTRICEIIDCIDLDGFQMICEKLHAQTV